MDEEKLHAFLGKAVGDIGAEVSANMVLLGDQLGLYKAMAKMGPPSCSIINATLNMDGLPRCDEHNGK